MHSVETPKRDSLFVDADMKEWNQFLTVTLSLFLIFSFNYTVFTIGRMVECINSICNKHPYYWMVYNATTNELLQKGNDIFTSDKW